MTLQILKVHLVEVLQVVGQWLQVEVDILCLSQSWKKPPGKNVMNERQGFT